MRNTRPSTSRRLKADPRLAPNPQSATVLKHLRKTGRITQRQAMADYSVQSLTKRISELRDAGFKIEGNWKKHPITGQRYMEYLLSK